MDNFVYGIQSIARGLSTTIALLGSYQLFWGFAIGFFVSTLVHIFLITDNPRHIPAMLFYDKGTSFQKIHSMSPEGVYKVSYSQFVKTVDKVKFVFGLAIMLFFVIIIITLFKY